jgi:hypothetical protein
MIAHAHTDPLGRLQNRLVNPMSGLLSSSGTPSLLVSQSKIKLRVRESRQQLRGPGYPLRFAEMPRDAAGADRRHARSTRETLEGSGIAGSVPAMLT